MVGKRPDLWDQRASQSIVDRNSAIDHSLGSSSVMSVSKLNATIRELLEGNLFYCQVEGEISNAAFPQSGHIYFNLKDDQAVVKGVIWRSQAMLYRSLIQNGQKVKVTGKITVYAPRGEYQLVISRVEEAGKGDLHLQFEALKLKLAQEGLFAPEHKKVIPKHPKRIGIITSPTAAALQDVLNVFRQHRPDIPLTLYETRVQGNGAEMEIASAIESANRENSCDLLLVIRGGGSIEDLWCFNEEVVVRAIFASHIPIITGVGHETDTTIADFVADLRAPTPSIAAKYSSQSKDELYQILAEYQEQLMARIVTKIEAQRSKVQYYYHRLQLKEPKLQLQHFRQQLIYHQHRLNHQLQSRLSKDKQKLSTLEQRLTLQLLQRKYQLLASTKEELALHLTRSMQMKLEQYRQAFQFSVEKLTLLSPLNVLLRGYSVTTSKETTKIVKSITQVQSGDQLSIKVADGIINAKVLGVE